MRRLLATTVFAALAFLPGASPAQDQAEEPDVNCKSPQTQMEYTYCAGVDLQKADDALNALWPKMVADARERDRDMADYLREMDVPSTEEALRAAQRAWIAFRDAQCDYESYATLGGTMQPQLGSACRADLTRERIKTLKANLAGLGLQ